MLQNQSLQSDYMLMALNQARKAKRQNEVPIGCVIIHNKTVIAKTYNQCEAEQSPLAHAEISAIHAATEYLGNWRLNECEMFITLEPCPMCLGAILQSRISKIHIGCYDHKRYEDSFFKTLKNKTQISDNNHNLLVEGPILEHDCSQILKDFFKNKRNP